MRRCDLIHHRPSTRPFSSHSTTHARFPGACISRLTPTKSWLVRKSAQSSPSPFKYHETSCSVISIAHLVFCGDLEDVFFVNVTHPHDQSRLGA